MGESINSQKVWEWRQDDEEGGGKRCLYVYFKTCVPVDCF